MNVWRRSGRPGSPASRRPRVAEWLLALAALVSACAAATPAAAQAGSGTVIGMVLDGPWERNAELLPVFRGEIEDLVGEDFGARVPPEKVLVADWTASGVHAALDRLLADAEVDLVVGLGVLASHELAERGDLPKPAFAPVVIDPELQGLPDVAGRSGVPNLNYLALPLSFERDVRTFLEIVPFERLAVLFSRTVMDAIPGLRARVTAAAGELGLSVDVIAATSAEGALASIPAGAQAVYVAPLRALEPAELDRLVEGLIERRLPSFARLDEREVRRGFLATRTSDELFPRLARRLALNIQSVLLGQDPGELRTEFRVPQRLTINMATGRAIGVYPPWSVVTEAVLLDAREDRAERRWSLIEAAREAVRVNRDLAARERSVAAGAQEVARARSRLLPQVEVASRGAWIDEDRAEASFGQQAQRSLSGSASLSQLLFAEPAWADLSAQGHLQEARRRDRDALALDVTLAASRAYVNVLRATTLERIRQENLRLTRTNLEDARLRVAIGSARPAEVLRWESEIAADRRSVIEASAERNVAEMEFNRVLHRPLEEPFELEDADLTDPELSFMLRLYPYIDDKWSFEVFRRFMSEEALREAPELAGFDAAIEAQSRALTSARRSYWLPTVGLQADVSRVLGEGGAGSAGPTIPDFLAFPTTDDVAWSVGVVASLPLFQGGRRAADTRRASAEVDRLRLERAAAAERVEQRVRTALHRSGASFAGIDLSRAAAEAARENLDLVRDLYGEGAATILDLLDAQNAFLVAELAAANAVYDFLIDFLQVQRAVGGFVFTMSPDERDRWFEALDRFMRENRP